jgi:hypothetical protein
LLPALTTCSGKPSPGKGRGSEQITNALDTLDHTIHEIREYVLAVAPDPGPADGDR